MLQTFVADLSLIEIRRNLLEKTNLDFSSAYGLAVARFDGYREASLYDQSAISKSVKPMVASTSTYEARLYSGEEMKTIAATAPLLACYFCGQTG